MIGERFICLGVEMRGQRLHLGLQLAQVYMIIFLFDFGGKLIFSIKTLNCNNLYTEVHSKSPL